MRSDMEFYKHIVLHLVSLGVCCVAGCAYLQPNDSDADNSKIKLIPKKRIGEQVMDVARLPDNTWLLGKEIFSNSDNLLAEIPYRKLSDKRVSLCFVSTSKIMDSEVAVMIKLADLCRKNNIKMYVQPCANRYCEPMVFLKVPSRGEAAGRRGHSSAHPPEDFQTIIE
jgi:hypothetical protein